MALELDHNYIGAEHLLLGLLRTDDGGAATILKAGGVEFAAAKEAVRTLQPPSASPSSIFDDLQRIEAKIDALTLTVEALAARLPPPELTGARS
jgi:ATP-dependent Clp protease ATP-binding subunit ClpA